MLNFVIDNNLPFSVIQSPSFKTMIQSIVGQTVSIPTTQTFMDYMKDQFDAVKNKLSHILNKQRHLCVTADVWSSRAQAYLGMTVHFINENFKRESFLLSFRRMKCKQTYSALSHEITKVLAEFSISTEKITHIVTDGGSAFCKAFRVFGKSVDHLIDHSEVADGVDDNPDEIPFIHFDDPEYFYSNIISQPDDDETDSIIDTNETIAEDEENEREIIQNDENDLFGAENDETETFLEQNEQPAVLPRHRRCVSHYANLVSNDFENALTGRSKTVLVNVVGKLKTIWVFPRRSALAKTIAQEELGCTLKIPVETRWNSKFNAIKHVFSLKQKMNKFVDELRRKIDSAQHLPKITNDDWLVISAYIKVMEPVANCIDRLQGEQNSCQGYILPTVQKMKHDITRVEGGNLTQCLKEAMLKVIEKRFSKFFKFDDTNRELVIAAVTMPKFKTDFIQYDSDVDMARRMLMTECVKLSSNFNGSADTPSTSTFNNDETFVSYASRRIHRRSSIELSIEGEIERYILSTIRLKTIC